jgi:hypothetical protein
MGERRIALVALAAMGEPRTATNARTRIATKKKGGGKGKGEGWFTSTGAEELRASSKSAIRFSLRGVERERSFWVEQGRERRLFSFDSGDVGAAAAAAGARGWLGTSGRGCSVGPARRGRGRAGSRQEPAGPRQGKGPRWAARAGASAGPRGRQTGPRREGEEKGGKLGWAAPGEPAQERGVLGFSYFLFNSNLS